LGRELACPVISADSTRKRILAIRPTEHRDDAPFRGANTPEMTANVYLELRRRAEIVLRSGRTAVIDASFRSHTERQAARALAERLRLPFLLVECRAPRPVIEQRLRARRAQEAISESDGRIEILADFLARWEPVNAEHDGQWVEVDTTADLSEALTSVLADLPRWPSAPTAGDRRRATR
jgi:predicted kinase